MAGHNLGTVIGFEFTRTLKKKSFWVTTLSVPIIIAVVFALVYISNSSTDQSAKEQANATITFVYTDASGLITRQQAAALGGSLAPDPARAVADVRTGRVQAYFAYPPDPATQAVRVYGQDLGIFNNGQYQAIAQRLLTTAATDKIGSPTLSTLVAGGASFEATTYRGGQRGGGLSSVIPPLLYLLVFYLTIFLLGNQMLNSTLEEKENRVTEMILTTLNATTLIIGKIITLFLVGLVQILAFAAPVLLAYLFFRDQLALPNLNLSSLRFESGPMIIGALLLLGGFLLFTGTLVAAGAIMPTAKEAGPIFAAMMILLFVPFYAISLILSDPSSPIVQIFTFFPYTAPVTAMVRNGLGSLPGWQAGIVITELIILGTLVLLLAVRIFRYGSIQYTSKVSLTSALGTRSTPPPAATGP
ncbi:MAG: ABC transporter permease, partial [Intrasporangium sp.]|uniref:ABC transporter permease n=1 Tax=Intrasporangium sp. TaxID=1925024 RepID=UPI002648A682